MDLNNLIAAAESLPAVVFQTVTIGNKATPEERFKAVVNTKTMNTAAIVSPQYNLIQHKDVILSVAEALNNLNINCDCRLSTTENRIFTDIKFTNATTIKSTAGEEFFKGIRIINSYDKTTGIIISPYLTRLACSNGMVLNSAWVKSFNVTHCSKLAKDFETVITKMLFNMANHDQKFKDLLNACIGDSIEWKIMDQILNKLTNGTEKHLTQIKRILKFKYALDKQQPTRWDLYNAVTEYATHGRQLSPELNRRLQAKAESVLITPLLKLAPIMEQV
jgi:hypothetical protein